MTHPYTTLSESQAPPAHLRQIMCRAFYEAGRPTGSSRPRFEDTSPDWRAAMDVEMTAAIQAALAAELITITGRNRGGE